MGWDMHTKTKELTLIRGYRLEYMTTVVQFEVGLSAAY
jgi:hypothetical protein